ncbi:hypothetical protein HID58_011605 [Brassica napus]|uniref:Uncharacterized protein n=1 Tax=Brassica napus TaxID=3708 RepID=A0ABQ8DZ53_BRANA|nr:hypothetical protein HID58_011605 [Brassica napus]
MNCGDEAGASSGHLDWRFSQVSGERSAGEEVQEVMGYQRGLGSGVNFPGPRTFKDQRRQVTTPARPSRPSLSSTTCVARRGAETPGSDKNGNTFDHTTKLLPLAWHPTENLIASAAAKSLYM